MPRKIITISINRKNKLTPTSLTEVNVPKGSKAIGIAVLFKEDTHILLEADPDQDSYEKKSFLTIKVGELLPEDTKLKFLGTAVIQDGHIIEQVYEIKS